MELLLHALLLLGAVAIVAGIILTLAAKFMAVPVDPNQVKVRECLPGANCGACGYAGCDDYASAVAANPDTPLNACVPGGAAVTEAIAAALGREALRLLRESHLIELCGVLEGRRLYAI